MKSEKLGSSKILNVLLKPAGLSMGSSLRKRLMNPVKILQDADVKPGETILEVGCGTGFFTIPAAQMIGEQGHLIAMDVMSGYLEQVSQKVEAEGLKNVRIIKRDALDTGLESESIDKVLLFGVLPFPSLPLNRLYALLGTVGIISGAVILAVHDIPHFVLPWIAENYVLTNGADPATFKYLGNVTLMTAMWGHSLGVTFLGLGFLAYGIFFVKCKSVPIIFGWVGVVSGVLISAGVWLPRYDESLYSLFVILASPLGLCQLALGVWLIMKGAGKD